MNTEPTLEAPVAAKKTRDRTMWAQLDRETEPSGDNLTDPDAEAEEQGDGVAADAPSWDSARHNAALRQVMAKRMIQARELNGLAQTEAALKIGWKNATQLSLIEKGTRLAPHQLLIRIACTYAVSIEFLYGLDDEPERDSRVANRNAHVRRIDHMLKQHVSAVADVLLDATHFDPAPALRQSGVVSRVTALCDAVARFRAVNPEQFENLKASATLVRTAQEAGEAIAKVNAWLTRADNHVKYAIQRGRAAMTSVAPTSDEGRPT